MTHYPCPVEHCDRPRRGDQNICGACQADIARALTAVPDLERELDVARARLVSRTLPTGRAAVVPLPYDPRASEAAAILRSALVGWVRELHTGAEPWPGDTLASMAAWLSERQGRILIHPAASEAHGELTAAVRAAQAAIDIPPARQYAGPCRACARPLYARPGASSTECRDCRTPHDVDERRAWMLEQVQDQLATAHQVAYALSALGCEIKPDRVRQWVRRGMLAPRGHDAARRRLYRIGDAYELLARLSERRTA